MLLVCVLLLSGCAVKDEDANGYLIFPTVKRETATQRTTRLSNDDALRIHACWLPYTELNPKKLLDINDYRAYLHSLLQPLKRLSVTDLFVQVRPFADAIYPSGLFEPSGSVVASRGDPLPFDFFSVILEQAAQLGFHVHAWINPYRILSDLRQIDSIDPTSQVGLLLQEPGTESILKTNSGLYLQPASNRAQKLILDGVRELLRGYSISGIHLDDYFYPPDAAGGDDVWYNAYRRSGGTLLKPHWRREQINTLLRAIYRLVHGCNEALVVSVSPAGDIDRDLSVHAADAALWAAEPGYCDWLIPQLYFGFRHATLPFATTAARWKTLCGGGPVQLLAGLAVYKVGKTDAYAGTKGADEWIENANLLAEQVNRIRALGFGGVALYAAEFVNFHEKACQKLELVL